MLEMSIATSKRHEAIDVTAGIADFVAHSGLVSGMCHVYLCHTTAALTVNEDADPSVMEDLFDLLEVLVPASGNFKHRDGNAAAHVKASLIGSSLCLPVSEGRLWLGRWQGVYLCEFDGPRQRTIVLQTLASEPR